MRHGGGGGRVPWFFLFFLYRRNAGLRWAFWLFVYYLFCKLTP